MKLHQLNEYEPDKRMQFCEQMIKHFVENIICVEVFSSRYISKRESKWCFISTLKISLT